MPLLVVAYPTISLDDYDWIQDYRLANNKKYFSVINPHFTFVFAVHDIAQDAFITEVKDRSSGAPKIAFEIKVATINKDNSGEFFHEFLVPDQGFSDIVKLHDKLYGGLFSQHQRLDIDYIPHIGIGNSPQAATSKERIDKINVQNITIPGVIETLDIIELDGSTVTTLDRVSLS